MSKLKPGMRARYIIFVVAVFGMFAYLTYGLVQLQLVQTEEYSETAESPAHQNRLPCGANAA